MIRAALAILFCIAFGGDAFSQATCLGDRCQPVSGTFGTITSIAISGQASAINIGLTPLTPVQASTTTVLPFAPTYNNGSSGNGATLTATQNGALTINGYSVLFGDRLLINNQALAYTNGIYTVTSAGSSTTAYQLVRATDASSGSQLFHGISVADLNTGSSWVLITNQPIAIGSTNLSFSQYTAVSASNSVRTNAQLIATPISSFPSGVWRLGVNSLGDASPLLFIPQTGTCASHGLASDVGYCNDTSTGGNSWLAKNGGIFEIEEFGITGDAVTGQGITTTAGVTTIGGITFPASMVGKPIAIYGAGSGGATYIGIIASTTSVTPAPSVTISSYYGASVRVATSSGGNVPNDLLTVTGGTCATAPVFIEAWISGIDINAPSSVQGSCSVIPSNPVTLTSSGAATNVTGDVQWWNAEQYLSKIVPAAGGSGYSTSDQLGIAGVTCSTNPVVSPSSVDGSGAITGLTIVTPGTCSLSTGVGIGIALTGGSGSGGTSNPRWLAAGYYLYGTDNTVALATVSAALNAAGGGTIRLPHVNNKYAIDLTNPNGTPAVGIWQLSGTTSGVWIEGNGGQFFNGHHWNFNEISSPVILAGNGHGFHVADFGITTAEPALWTAGGPTTIAISGLAKNTPSDYDLEGVTCANGRAAVIVDGPDFGSKPARRINIRNGAADNCEYGVALTNAAPDTTIRGFSCFGCGRTLFIYGSDNIDASVTSQNSVVNDLLMYGNFGGSLDDNVRINYHYRPRLNSVFQSALSGGPIMYIAAASSGAQLQDISLHFDMDYRGETVQSPTALFCGKLGQVNAASIWSGIHISGTITNIQNLAGKLINCPGDQDTNWSNETFTNFTFDKLTTSGSATPTEYSDLGGFSGTSPLTIRDSNVIGAWTFANQAATNLVRGNTTIAGSRAGNVGELLSNSAALGSINLTDPNAKDITTLALTTGVWDAQCQGYFLGDLTTTAERYQVGISTAADTIQQTLGAWTDWQQQSATPTNNGYVSLLTPTYRISLNSGATYHCVGQSHFGTSTMTEGGYFRATRVQ